ncbi:hypothetical protein YSA_11024 [Pseudomonas putida ND6]|uniref:Uncharacterized protein n=1 Tax=Pseudomonas putida ND6 TaxID=231023 RepID=I3V4S5_PSEPU|nr:hypothetical protein YSA_11024 [Pseudomonas putida ND6]
MLVPRPAKCAIAALNCKIIQGGTRVNQDLMHGGGRPHRGEIRDAFNTLDLLSSPTLRLQEVICELGEKTEQSRD